LNGAFDTAFGDGKLEGKIEGKLEGKMEIAKSLKDMGVLTATIIASTGLTKEEIEKL
jgi:predicted transposase/invertase (TIGR01784 family)